LQEKDIRLQLAPVEHIAEAMGKGSKSDRMRTRPVRSRSGFAALSP
jgi:hypothetical protein